MITQKNVLLVNPWIYDFTAFDFWLRPLGLLYMAAVLEKYSNLHLDYIDCLDRYHPSLPPSSRTIRDGRGDFHKEEVLKPDVLKDIPRRFSRYGIPMDLFKQELAQIPTPDLVLVTCTMTYWYIGVQVVIDLIRQKFGPVPVLLGGIYASLVPDHAKRSSGADIVLEGPGEQKLLYLIREILGESVALHKGIDGLESLPLPSFHWLRNTESLPFLTSRGCPFSCDYCASRLLFSGFEQMPVPQVIDHLNELKVRYGASHVAFYDDALLVRKESHIIPILEGILGKGLSLAFHTPNGLHVNEIDEHMARLFRKANFKSLFLSWEGLDRTALNASSTKIKPGDLEKALNHLIAAGYSPQEIMVYVLIGLPGQDIDSIRENITYVTQLGASPRLAYFSPVPGTPDWQKVVSQGYIPEHADPLLHNKLVFPYLWGDVDSEDFHALKTLLVP